MNITPLDVERLGVFREEALGRIYEGSIRETNRRVIVKEFIPPPALNKTSRVKLRLRFLEDANALKSLLDSCIAIPLSIGEMGEKAFVIYHLPPGIPLSSHLEAKGALPPPQAFQIFRRIIGCFRLLTNRGVRRTNVIPDDFFVSESNTIQMVDTTLAVYEKASGLIDVGILTGDVAFYAPEQVEKGKAGEQTLVFSLGLLFYWILTGKCLYGGGSPFETLSQILKKPYTSLPESVDASVELYDFVRRILRKEESQRFASLDAMSSALEKVTDRERIERSVREQEKKVAPASEAISPKGYAISFRKVLTWLVILIAVVWGGLSIKKWFFSLPEVTTPSRPTSVALLNRARRALRDRQWETARVLARNVLRMDKTNSRASLILGETYFGERRFEDAIRNFRTAENSRDEVVRLRASYLIAESKIQVGEFIDAERILTRLIPQARTDVERQRLTTRRTDIIDLCFKEGRELARNHEKPSLAAQRLRKLAKTVSTIDSARTEADFLKGMAAYLDKDFKQAFTFLNRYCGARPDDAFADAVFRKVIRSTAPPRP